MDELIKKAKWGDAESFVLLMESQKDVMYKTAWAVLGNDADVADAVQEAIITCFEKIGTLRQPKYFKTWMVRILLNICFKMRSQKSRYVDEEIAPEPYAEDDPLSATRFKELLAMAEERDRLLLTLYYRDEFSGKEIAELLKMNENTVRTRLARAREQIRRKLDE